MDQYNMMLPIYSTQRELAQIHHHVVSHVHTVLDIQTL